MEISIIAAVSSNNVIGNKGKIPWYIPNDLKHFKQLTTGNAIIMGRKTHESIGRVLPNRENIIISRNINYVSDGCIMTASLHNAISYANMYGYEKVFIIGGGEIYKQAIELGIVHKMYITHILKNFEGDTYFPDIDIVNKKIFDKDLVIYDHSVSFNYEFVEYKVIK